MSIASTALKRPFGVTDSMDKVHSDTEYSTKIQRLDSVRSSSEPFQSSRLHPSMNSHSTKPSLRSSPSTNSAQSPAPRSPRNFDPDSTLVIIGQRGSGKSSLAVIAAAALRRRFVDVDQYFEKATGMSRAGLIRERGM